jgi:hypothetical protein
VSDTVSHIGTNFCPVIGSSAGAAALRAYSFSYWPKADDVGASIGCPLSRDKQTWRLSLSATKMPIPVSAPDIRGPDVTYGRGPFGRSSIDLFLNRSPEPATILRSVRRLEGGDGIGVAEVKAIQQFRPLIHAHGAIQHSMWVFESGGTITSSRRRETSSSKAGWPRKPKGRPCSGSNQVSA